MNPGSAAFLAEQAEEVFQTLTPNQVHRRTGKKHEHFLAYGSAGGLRWLAMIDIGTRGGSVVDFSVYDGSKPFLCDRLSGMREREGVGVPFLRLASQVGGDISKLYRAATNILQNFIESVESGRIDESALQQVFNRCEGRGSGESIRAWRG